MLVLLLTLTLFTSGLMIFAAANDFLKLKIPNLISVAIVICFTVAYGLYYYSNTNASFQPLTSHLIAGGIMLVVMMILFFAHLFGGGDAKMTAAISLWVGIEGLPLFLMVTSISGAILALLSITLRKTPMGQKIIVKLLKYPQLHDGWVNALAKGTNVLPYGIAIAIGGITTFRHLGYLP